MILNSEKKEFLKKKYPIPTPIPVDTTSSNEIIVTNPIASNQF